MFGLPRVWFALTARIPTFRHTSTPPPLISLSRPLAPQAMADAATLWALHGYLKPLNTPASSAFLSPRVCARSSWEVCEKQSGMGCLNDWVNVFTFICFKQTLAPFFTSICLFRSLMGLLQGFMHICFGTPCWWIFATTALTTLLKIYSPGWHHRFIETFSTETKLNGSMHGFNVGLNRRVVFYCHCDNSNKSLPQGKE